MFLFEPLQNLHLGESKLGKKCLKNYLSSSSLRTGGLQREGNAFVEIRSRKLRECNLLLRAIESDGMYFETGVDLSKGGI